MNTTSSAPSTTTSPTGPPTEPTTRDHYADLGISPTASAADIRRAYHRRAQETHPDKIAPGQAIDAVEFRRVQTAYSVLSQPYQRLFYDGEHAAIAQQWAEYKANLFWWEQQEEMRKREVLRARMRAAEIARRIRGEVEKGEGRGAGLAGGVEGEREMGVEGGEGMEGVEEREGGKEEGVEKETEGGEEEEEEEEDTSRWTQGDWVNWELKEHSKNAAVLGYFPTERECACKGCMHRVERMLEEIEQGESTGPRIGEKGQELEEGEIEEDD